MRPSPNGSRLRIPRTATDLVTCEPRRDPPASRRIDQVGDVAAGLFDGGAQRGSLALARSVLARGAKRGLAALRQIGDAVSPDHPGRTDQGVQEVRRRKAGHGIVAAIGIETGLNLARLAHEQAEKFRLEALVAEGLPGQMDKIDRAPSATRVPPARFGGEGLGLQG